MTPKENTEERGEEVRGSGREEANGRRRKEGRKRQEERIVEE